MIRHLANRINDMTPGCRSATRRAGHLSGKPPRARGGHTRLYRPKSEPMGAPHEGRIIPLPANCRIKGHIDLLSGARVTDYILAAQDFIAATEAEMWGVGQAGPC
jgi:hypothetical protein